MMRQEINLGITRYPIGFVDKEESALICSVTVMAESSAHTEAPTLPVTIKAVRIGPSSEIIGLATIIPAAPAKPLAPNW